VVDKSLITTNMICSPKASNRVMVWAIHLPIIVFVIEQCKLPSTHSTFKAPFVEWFLGDSETFHLIHCFVAFRTFAYGRHFLCICNKNKQKITNCTKKVSQTDKLFIQILYYILLYSIYRWINMCKAFSRRCRWIISWSFPHQNHENNNR